MILKKDFVHIIIIMKCGYDNQNAVVLWTMHPWELKGCSVGKGGIEEGATIVWHHHRDCMHQISRGATGSKAGLPFSL
jgi:hypothetical protein